MKLYLMKGHRYGSIFYFPLTLLVLFAPGCAKVSSPGGGPRDRESPVIVRSMPEQGTKNFTGKEIVITFDEYVVLEKINEKLMVSPPLKTRPRIRIKGKSIIVGYDEVLRDSTTYTFYFQDAIRDLNENNPIDNYQFVFSTGPVIDSLSVTGNVRTAYNLEVPENTLVLLYSQLADSAVKKMLPDYITRVGKNSEFRIDNVKPGKYRIYALKDVDNSKNYNIPDEEFAFRNDTVLVDPVRNYLPPAKDTAVARSRDGTVQIVPPVEGEYSLILFQPQRKTRYLTSSSRRLPYQLTYTLSLPPDSIDFSFALHERPDDSFFIERNPGKDTIIVWLTDSTVYSQPVLATVVEYPFTDSLGLTVARKDTIMMRHIAARPARAKSPSRNEYRVTTGITSGRMKPDGRIVLTSPTPFRPPDTSRIKFFEVLKDGNKRMPFNLRKDSANSCRYFLDVVLEQGKDYLFSADSAAFGSVYGEYNDSTGFKVALMSPESLGKLILNIRNNTGNIIVHLLDNTEKIVREVPFRDEGKIEFPYLDKGFYRLRVIYDLNGDGKWTTGDFDRNLQPEPVSYYPAEIEVKVNWEIVQDWDISLRNIKDFKLTSATKGRR